ncbi:MAG: MFS transporter [Dehalococcoidia bacterium]
MRSWTRRTFAALDIPEYRVLFLGSTAAMLAFTMSWTVQSVVAFDIAGTNTAVGIVSLGSGAAMLVLGPFGGVLADRLSKRTVLFVAQGGIGLIYAVLGVLVVTGTITVFWLALGTFIMGLGFTVIGPARQAYIGELVPVRALANAIALSQLSQTFARIVSPLTAGVLIGITMIGAGGAYFVMTALFVYVLVSLRGLPPGVARVRAGSLIFELGAGMRHVAANRRRMLLATGFVATVMAGFSFQAVLPGLLEHELGQPARMVGPLMGVSAIGGFAAAITLAGSAGGRHAWPLMFGGGVVFGLSLLALAVTPSMALAFAVVVVIGAGMGGFQLMNNSLLMLETEAPYHGRVMSIMTLAWGANGLIALPIGALADAVGERAVLAGQGTAVIAVAAATAALFFTRNRAGEPATFTRGPAAGPAPGA